MICPKTQQRLHQAGPVCHHSERAPCLLGEFLKFTTQIMEDEILLII
jgi:hypothetical protein